MTSGPSPPEWDAALYAANTAHHRAFDAWFLEACPIRSTDHLVDLGCGAGDFTRTLADLVPSGEVVGVDPQPGFLQEAARRAGPNQRFVLGRAQDLAVLLPPGRADGVASRAALQWVPWVDHPAVTRGVLTILRPGGWYRLEMSAAGNIARVVALLDAVSAGIGGATSPWCFPDPGAYLELVESAGFRVDHVRSVAQRRPFTAESLAGWLRSQVYPAYEATLPAGAGDEFRGRVEEALDRLRRHDGAFDQTFVRLDLLVWKPA
jgi:trans-aconitate methyltransferase